jgi:hypothetical protein
MRAGSLETSELNPTLERLLQSYRDGRTLAQRCGLYDHETELATMAAADPALYRERRAELHDGDPLIQREQWHAMFESGLRPHEVYDTAIREALAARRSVQFIDPSHEALHAFAGCAKCHILLQMPAELASCVSAAQHSIPAHPDEPAALRCLSAAAQAVLRGGRGGGAGARPPRVGRVPRDHVRARPQGAAAGL